MSRGAPTVAVLGMHRSGTSAVAGALAAMGLQAGREADLLPGDPGNPRGYFELREMVRLNDRLLSGRALAQRARLFDEELRGLQHLPRARRVLDDYGWLTGSWTKPQEEPATPQWQRAAASCIEGLQRQADGAPASLVKDPRLCLTLADWRRGSEDWLAVIVLRSPAAAAASLSRRDLLPRDVGLHLWARYLRSALEQTQGMPRIVVDYERLLSDPAAGLATLGRFLAAQGVAIDTARLDAATAFVEPGLRRAEGCAAAGGDADRLHAALRASAPAIADELPTDRTGAEASDALLRQALRVVMHPLLAEVLARLLRHPLGATTAQLLRRLKRDVRFDLG